MITEQEISKECLDAAKTLAPYLVLSYERKPSNIEEIFLEMKEFSKGTMLEQFTELFILGSYCFAEAIDTIKFEKRRERQAEKEWFQSGDDYFHDLEMAYNQQLERAGLQTIEEKNAYEFIVKIGKSMYSRVSQGLKSSTLSNFEKILKTETHYCFRNTNWVDLASNQMIAAPSFLPRAEEWLISDFHSKIELNNGNEFTLLSSVILKESDGSLNLRKEKLLKSRKNYLR
ncbi:MAG: hypothetical protein ABH824_05815 [Nanoarchaeota archaeon]|nr:hypothetical protein [Nanoarchaeota archaeon]MBU1632409.1 hypothetical protein [Nanoarchaeota archaeon]MBU1876563.1 hypothetical protein [Nanoarchaeota archaeon]